MTTATWDVRVDRGGRFTDIVARRVGGGIGTYKLLFENPERTRDVA